MKTKKEIEKQLKIELKANKFIDGADTSQLSNSEGWIEALRWVLGREE